MLSTSVVNGDSGWGKFLQNNDTSTLRLTSSTKQAFRNVGDGEEKVNCSDGNVASC